MRTYVTAPAFRTALERRLKTATGGRRFEQIQLDVAWNDPYLGSEPVQGEDLLSFAGIKPVTVLSIPAEQHIAEKVHAYTRSYASGPSSRPKDLVDLVLMALHRRVDAARLRQALQATFTTRNTHPLPPSIPAPPQEWDGPYRRLATEVDISANLADAHHIAGALLDPMLADDTTAVTWEPAGRRWLGS
jgi:hypothetical protein